jgi:serine/threonine-protein kinase
MAPLLFNADEIAASLVLDPAGGGDLGHAIRFILPNARMANDPDLGGAYGRLYVRPATHAGGPSGPAGSVPYGSRLRLRADFPLDGYNPAARVILNTFKRYGIVLADGGTVALTAESDLYTTAKWADLGIDSRVFDQTSGATDVTASDFDVVDTGLRIAETYDCVRTDVEPRDVIFADGFESGGTSSWSSTLP